MTTANNPDLKRKIWRVIQGLVWLIGLAIVMLLLLKPTVGIHAFWNVLIPVAPALLVFLPGLWRNICPLGTTALLPRHLGFSRQKKISVKAHQRLGLGGLLLLLLLVPLRHLGFNLSGPATAILVLSLTIFATLLGTRYEWKSAWCSGLCPVHPVEKLYGHSPAATLGNAHCDACQVCVHVCPDSGQGEQFIHEQEKGGLRALVPTLLIGGFPGYIWGWFQVPDYEWSAGLSHLGEIYLWPWAGLADSLAVYLLARSMVQSSQKRTLAKTFVTLAVACYYWFRLPALFGFGLIEGDGMLVDLSGLLPQSFPAILRIATVLC
ncbi:MAG: hypothetical protein V3W41_11890 [Planctomycetota bacterium]